ncbi:MAG: gamma-butyrobetaine hydroxylase family protein [Saccharospirillum sp.]
MAEAPKKITYHKADSELELVWPDGVSHRLSAEFLRVHSPSAEVRGHGVGQEVLQTGKRLVAIVGLEPVGRYALKIVFDDGHDSGLFNWEYLRELGDQHAEYWQAYLDKLADAGQSREPQFIQAKQL